MFFDDISWISMRQKLWKIAENHRFSAYFEYYFMQNQSKSALFGAIFDDIWAYLDKNEQYFMVLHENMRYLKENSIKINHKNQWKTSFFHDILMFFMHLDLIFHELRLRFMKHPLTEPAGELFESPLGSSMESQRLDHERIGMSKAALSKPARRSVRRLAIDFERI